MLAVDSLYAGYGGKNVIHDISFTARAGECVSIIGPNGCGKTTLLRAIAGLIPFAGRVSIRGRDFKALSRADAAREIAVLSQITPVYFNLTVYEVVMLGRYPHIPKGFFNKPGMADREAAEAALYTVHMREYGDRELGTLSGGQMQRVFLAKTLAQDPKIILLDEPTNHLDLSYQMELINFLKDWSKQGERCVVGVLHDINLALLLSGKILLMNDGRAKTCGDGELDISELGRSLNMDVAAYIRGIEGIWKKLAAS